VAFLFLLPGLDEGSSIGPGGDGGILYEDVISFLMFEDGTSFAMLE
jgi:hypothetical protein